MPRLTRRWALGLAGAAALGAALYYYCWTEDEKNDDSNISGTADPTESERGASLSNNTHNLGRNGTVDIKDKQRQAQLDINAHVDAHFRSIQTIAKETTVATLLAPLSDSLKNMDDMDDLIVRLQREKASLTTQEKLSLWHEVLERVLCRFVCVVWLVPTLHLTIRVQLNIMGRSLYLQKALSDGKRTSKTRPRSSLLSVRAQEAYLRLSEHVGAAGYLVMRDLARTTSKQVASELVADLGSVGAKTSAEHVCKVLGHTLAVFERECLEGDGWRGWEASVVPPEEEVRKLFDGAELDPEERFEVEGMWRETVGVYRREAFKRRYLAGCARALAAAMLQRVRLSCEATESKDTAHVPLVSILPLLAREVDEAMAVPSAAHDVLCEHELAEAMSARVYANGSL